MSDNNTWEWFCTLCEATFAHDKETEAINHMWDNHAASDPFRMFTWQSGEIMELEEREREPAP